MEAIRNLVQVLVVVIVLAVFLDMLLPRGDLKSYVRMVMGLFIMVALIQTAGDLFHLEMDCLLEPVAGERVSFGSETRTKEILKKGGEISAGQRHRAVEHYRQGIKGQVLALARLHGSTSVFDVDVKVKEEEGPAFGRLEEIVLHVSSGISPGNGAAGQAVWAASEGGINRDDKSATPSSTSEVADLVGVLAGFYNLDPRQVKIAAE